MARNDPTLAMKVCVALVAEGPTHGWAIAGLLAPGAEIGRIWSLSRPLTYRSLDQATTDGLVERSGTEPGGGRSRTLLAATEEGQRRNAEWLAAVVSLPRDVRTELLLKFALRERLSQSNGELASRQRELFTPMLTSREPGSEDFVSHWKHEHLLAIDRFLAGFSVHGS